ncbi:TPA: hypothetical protein N0F65_002861 [Lagenidium giganteum]|uniref:FHA domain-containing protein n=1 Tax=Lagenidium giganteum TaxID=4803 RepID=A0AAV2ZE89_9STRA|nr:TPA: hypothetical protein N0F65_002861 [Lagenidium giganteum]
MEDEHYTATASSIVPSTQETQLVQDFLQQVPLEALFQCLQAASEANDAKKVRQIQYFRRVHLQNAHNDEMQVKVFCSCIDRVLGADGSDGIFFRPEIVPFLIAGLQHAEQQARLLTVKQLETHLSRKPIVDQVAVLFARVPDSEMYKPVLAALKTKALSIDLAEESVEYVRCLESITKICAASDRHMEFGIEHQCVDLVLDGLKSNDPLFLMNVVDILPYLCETRLGIQHIFRSDPFVGGSSVRLVGELSASAAKLEVKSWNWDDPALSKAFLSTIEQKAQSNDQQHQIAAMDAIAAFGASSEKELYLLLQHKSLCKEWLQVAASTKMPLKVNCLHSVATILRKHTRLVESADHLPAGNAAIWGLNEALFNQLGLAARQKSTVDYLMECLKQPFEELRTGVYSVLQAVAAQNNDWGIRALMSYGGFFEFLLDRSTEPNKETREWKFAVVDATLASPFQEKLDEVTLSKLRAHLARGPYVGNAPPEMDMEAAACEPIEANAHARLEAFRDSKQCATYMISTKLVNIFGRDQESCDHVLGNPSVSRKHAAVIHNEEGGIFIVDLMSRHGTYINKKKIPPHDPFLLHEGDTVKFGQSVRVYILKGASPEGLSAGVKKSWPRMKLKAPRVSITAVLPKRQSRPRHSATMVKLVADYISGSVTDEKTQEFLNNVMELEDEDRKEVSDILVEKIQAKYRNAYTAVITLLKHNMCVEELEENLSVLTQISQQRYDNAYRADARKILQLFAAVRLDPSNVQSPTQGSYSRDGSDSGVSHDDHDSYNPNGMRNRVLSGEGKRLFLASHGVGAMHDNTPGSIADHGISSRRSTIDGKDEQYRGRDPDADSQDDDRSDDGYAPPAYAPPVAHWQTSAAAAAAAHRLHHYPQTRSIGHSGSTMSDSGDAVADSRYDRAAPVEPSGFGFIAKSEPDSEELPVAETHAKTSAFGFIANKVDEEEDSPSGRPSDQTVSGFGFMAQEAPAEPEVPEPSVKVEEFLAESPEMDPDDFAEIWESTNESEEWTTELASTFDYEEFLACLECSRIAIVSTGKVDGMQQILCCAEQMSNESMFLVEIMLMPGLADMTVTFKWVVNSLLYGNGHLLFIELFQHCLRDFCVEESEPVPPKRVSGASSHTNVQEVASDEPHEHQSIRDYLTERPVVEPAQFEHLWVNGTVIGTLSLVLEDIPEKEDVISLFEENCLACLASGCVNHMFKFYFVAEMVELQCYFCVEMIIDAHQSSVVGVLKRLSLQQHSEDDEERIDSSFVQFFEELVHEL